MNCGAAIGNVHPDWIPLLYRTTAECAIQAAVADPRFMPLTIEELVRVGFEISILSPMEKVDDVNTIQVGPRRAVYQQRRDPGLLLPQVATANGWDRDRFLTETCKKAGLKGKDWKDGASIFKVRCSLPEEKRRKA